MNTFYSMLYGKFSELQPDQSFSAKLVYPSKNPLPTLKVSKEISDCRARVPAISSAKNIISYGSFLFADDDFGQAAIMRVTLASTSLLSAKAVFSWLYLQHIDSWVASKKDVERAKYVISLLLEKLSRQWIRKVEGEDFYRDVMISADLFAVLLLSRRQNDFVTLSAATITSFLLSIPVQAPPRITTMAQEFTSKLNTHTPSPSKIIERLRSDLPNLSDSDAIKLDMGWGQIEKVADDLYAIIEKIPGKWHNASLPYSNAPDSIISESIFQQRLIAKEEFDEMRSRFENGTLSSEDGVWQELYFEFLREQKRNEKTLGKLSRATTHLNFGKVGFPISDYVSYHNLHTELSPQIRRMIERVSLVKNVLDENTFQESGNIDLQVAIQAIASKTPRNDLFVKDENLLKNEMWTILIDSSLSLDSSSKQVKAVSICLAETARDIMGSNPWGMFAFSDDLYCIKDFLEPYDTAVKARIGGISQGGLSFIPDAIRACRSMIVEHAMDKNYLILVSDGLPSGYVGIEQEFSASIKELAKHGIDLAAIGIGSSRIKKTIKDARVIEKPADIVKGFMEIYYGISS